MIVFPDVEALVIAAVNGDFDTHYSGDVHASTRVPRPRPQRFLTVARYGGQRESLISENAWITLDAWAETEADAVAILSRATAVLQEQDGPLFGYGEIGRPVNLPDPTTSQIRYTQNISVRARGAVPA